VPRHLAEFDPRDWRPLVTEKPPPGTENVECWLDLTACVLWGEARERWAAEHGWPLGDLVDRVREQIAVRRSILRRWIR